MHDLSAVLLDDHAAFTFACHVVAYDIAGEAIMGDLDMTLRRRDLLLREGGEGGFEGSAHIADFWIRYDAVIECRLRLLHHLIRHRDRGGCLRGRENGANNSIFTRHR